MTLGFTRPVALETIPKNFLSRVNGVKWHMLLRVIFFLFLLVQDARIRFDAKARKRAGRLCVVIEGLLIGPVAIKSCNTSVGQRRRYNREIEREEKERKRRKNGS